MQIVADRLKGLRHSTGLSQAKFAPVIDIKQSGVNRYENNQSDPSYETLMKYANYFDVSLDYIFGRTDNPKGTQFENKPKVEKIYPEMDKFIEMCFDPASPMNEKLKETLKDMLKGEAE